LHLPFEAEISAAATGCTAMVLSRDRFAASVGPLLGELQRKWEYTRYETTLKDMLYLGMLGTGQFGVVRRVTVRGIFGEEFALKRISKSRVIELDQQASCVLEREILVDACHPSIVRLAKTFQDETSVYLLMEALDGGDLFSALREIGALNEEQALFFGASIVLPVDYLHSRGFIYRDLKPENVMLDSHGFIKLVDFGCCTRKTRSYTFVGTPEYLAPEVILGTGYGKAVDWWGVGVIMYEMIVGPLPFGTGEANDPMETFREVLEKPLFFPSWVSEPAQQLMSSLMERMPELRLGSSTMHWRNEVHTHIFFRGLQWDAILTHTTKPPYQPPRHGGAADDSGDLQHTHSGISAMTMPEKPTQGFSPVGSVHSKSLLVPNSTVPVLKQRGDGTLGPSHSTPPSPSMETNIEYGKVPDDEEVHHPPPVDADLSCFLGF
jgi:cGMP-dependent protein kinase